MLTGLEFNLNMLQCSVRVSEHYCVASGFQTEPWILELSRVSGFLTEPYVLDDFRHYCFVGGSLKCTVRSENRKLGLCLSAVRECSVCLQCERAMCWRMHGSVRKPETEQKKTMAVIVLKSTGRSENRKLLKHIVRSELNLNTLHFSVRTSEHYCVASGFPVF